jgi:hypothetical protein
MGDKASGDKSLIQNLLEAFGTELFGKGESLRPTKPDITVVKSELSCQLRPFLSHLSDPLLLHGDFLSFLFT